MALRRDILELLADGRVHSGAALAGACGLSRTAVWKQVRSLRERGMDVRAHRGLGYQIPGGLDLLSAAAITARLRELGVAPLSTLEVLLETESTNDRLTAATEPGGIHRSAVIAEYQNAGRGRRGRQWQSPPASGLLLSLGWRFERGAATLAGLSLAAGVAIHDALTRCGVGGVGLKWPNDLYAGGRKLGGMLIELRGEAASGMNVVVGVGINVRAHPADDAALRVPATSIARLTPDPPPRNELAAAIVASLLDALPAFAREGFERFREGWLARDVSLGHEVRLDAGDERIAGRVRGVDVDGALLLESAGTVQRYLVGDVSLLT